MKIFFYYLSVIFKCRLKFRKPAPAEIVLYDQGLFFNKIFKENFKKKKIEILYTRLEEINLYVLFRSFLRLNSFNIKIIFLNYLICYCNIIKPKWIISSNHFDLKFYDLKKNMNPSIKFGIVQRAPVFDYQIKNFFNIFSKGNKKYNVDYYFSFDNSSIQILKNYFNANFVIIGSFLNNCYPIKKTCENRSILLISSFRPETLKLKKKRKRYQTDVKHEIKLTKLLITICEEQNINFRVLLKPLTKINEYVNLSGINEKYCIFNNGLNNYTTINKFHLFIFTNDSTLRFEVVSRKKTFCIIQPLNQLDKAKLGSSCVLNMNLNYKGLLNLIKSTLNQDYKTFKSKNIDLTQEVLFDEDNSILKSYINSNKKDLLRAH